MKKITGLLIDVMNERVSVETIPDSLAGYYKVLACEMIEILPMRIARRNYTIVCDEEALLKDVRKISAINDFGQAVLVGNLFVVSETEDGELRSLTQDDIVQIRSHVCMQGTHKYPTPYPMLHQVSHAWA